jgi:hypothetical protein
MFELTSAFIAGFSASIFLAHLVEAYLDRGLSGATARQTKLMETGGFSVFQRDAGGRDAEDRVFAS